MILSALPPAGADSVPTIGISDSVLVPGTSVTITGSGWPFPSTFQAMLCGDDALDGSIDCAVDAAATMSAAHNGRFADQLQVVTPPRPCPCVIQFSALESSYSSKLPVEVVGAAFAPIASQAPDHLPPTVRVTAKVTGHGTLGSFFGFPALRTLTLTVRNLGRTPVEAPVVSAGWGAPGGAQHIINAPALRPLAGGHTSVINMPFKLDEFAHRSYVVSGRYTGAPIPASFEATTTAPTPWGLIIAAIVLLQLLLLAVRNMVRRRLRRRDAARRAVERALLLPVPASASATRVAVVPGPIIALGGKHDGAEMPASEYRPLPASFVPPPPPPRPAEEVVAPGDEVIPPAPNLVTSDGSIHWRAPESSAPTP